jgi:hypothetical protein
MFRAPKKLEEVPSFFLEHDKEVSLASVGTSNINDEMKLITRNQEYL